MIIKTLSTVLALYFLAERAGVFRSQPATSYDVLHSYPFLSTASMLAAALIWNVCSATSPLLKCRLVRSFVAIGLVLISIGLWASHLLHFQGSVIRMDRQDFLALPGEYEEFSVKKGPWATFNSVGMYLHSISFRKMPLMDTYQPEVAVRYISSSRRALSDAVISPIRPLFTDWTMVRVTGAGYSVAYAIDDQTKREIDRTYVALKLYPPGTEDFFSPKDLGYYWHLRYYPDYIDNNGTGATRSLEQKNPVFGVRVVRNKDIVYNGFITMANTLQIEGVLFNIKDVRPCVTISFTRDPGMPVMLFGLLLTGIGLTVGAILRDKNVVKN